MKSRLRGLYAITSEALCRDPATLVHAIDAVLQGGAAMVQYRDKWNEASQRLENARRLAAVCRRYPVPLIVNDDPKLAAESGAAGVHLGTRDVSLAEARTMLGNKAVIGVTCGNSLERAQAAQAAGADYVSFGRFFASRTKPEAPPADPALLPMARAALDLPICAIGGLTPENAGPLVGAGADLIAAVGAVFDAGDITQRARAFSALFTTISQ